MREHLPAILPHHQFAVIGSAVGTKGKRAWGSGSQAGNQQEPQVLLKGTVTLRGAL